MREFFELYRPKEEARVLLRKILEVVADYEQQGFTLTLRQLYYQLVAADLIPNQEKSYKRVGDIVSRARLSGMMDWDAIEDRVRVPVRPPEYSSLDDLVEAAFHSYRLPRLKGQEQYVELWVEKDALAGVLRPIASHYHVTMMVNRGYSSTSAMKESGERLRAACRKFGVDSAYVLYLGDLDPSGEDMVRDISQRLDQFVNSGVYLVYDEAKGKTVPEDETKRLARLNPIDVVVEKLALTMAQVDEHEPPPNPAKLSDSRAAKYVEEFGEHSWEVDALPPSVLRSIIEDRLDELIDQDKMDEIMDQEKRDKKRLRKALESLQEE